MLVRRESSLASHTGGIVNGTTTLKTYFQYLLKLNMHLALWLNNSTLRYIPNRNETHVNTKTGTWMFIERYSYQLRSGNDLDVHQLTDKWINNMWYIHTVEYYSAVKRNDVTAYATT